MANEQQNNIPKLGTKAAIGAIEALYHARRPGMLWGSPGIGKTALIYQAAKNLGIDVIDFRLVTTEPTDLRGYPVILKDAEGQPRGMAWAPADLLPKTGAGILFLDELPQAPTMNMNAAAELIYDRRLGNDYVLPEGWSTMAAGNRRGDRAGTIEVPTHMKNRLVHMEIEPKVDEWAEWAKPAGLHDEMIEFLKANPRLFHAFVADAMAFPTPRSWEFVSQFLLQDNLDPTTRRVMIQGSVGKGAAAELEAYLDRGKGMPKYEDIIADPKNAPVGAKESHAYALSVMVASQAKAEDLDAVCIYFKRMRPEVVRAPIHRMMSDHPEFLTNASFKELAKKLGESKG